MTNGAFVFETTSAAATASGSAFVRSPLAKSEDIPYTVHNREHAYTYMNGSVKSAVRVLDLLELFAVVQEAMGVSEVAKRMEIPKSSAQALLQTLAGRGYLQKDGDGYALPLELRGGWVGGVRSRLLGLAAPVMQQMVEESGESAFVGRMTSGGKIQYLAKAVSPKEVRYDASLVHLRPSYCTSMGLVILAWMSDKDVARWLKPSLLLPVTPRTETDPERIREVLRQARKDGYVEVRETNVEGASGVSAPIFGISGEVIAALNLGAPSSRYDASRDRLIRIVCREAALISENFRAVVTAGRMA